MEAVASRQDPKSARARARELDRRLDRLRTAVCENGVTEPGGGDREQSLRELACRRGNRRDHQIGARLSPDCLQRVPNRFRIVTERNGSELSDEIRVRRSLGIEQKTSLAAHEFLVESKSLIQKTLVRRDVPNVGILFVLVPIRYRRQYDRLVVQGKALGPGGVRAWCGRAGVRRLQELDQFGLVPRQQLRGGLAEGALAGAEPQIGTVNP